MDKIEFEVDGKPMALETGRLGRQSNGAVLVSSGRTAVLVTVNSAAPRPGMDFFPLTVDYFEKSYAAGHIPGGFFKREGRQSEKEILTSRFIDRSLRPLFPDGYRANRQVIAHAPSCDDGVRLDMMAFGGPARAFTCRYARCPVRWEAAARWRFRKGRHARRAVRQCETAARRTPAPAC